MTRPRRPLARGPSPLRVNVRRLGGEEPQCEAGLYTNDFFLVIFVVGGPGRFRTGRRTRELQPGDLFVVAPGEVHDDSGLFAARGAAVAFMPEGLSARFDSDVGYPSLPGDPRWLSFLRQACLMDGHFSVPPQDRPSWIQRIDDLDRETRVQHTGFEQAARALLTLILVEAARLAMPKLAQGALPIDPVVATCST